MTIDEAKQEIESIAPKQINFSSKEAAKILGKSMLTLSRWRKQGIGPVYKDNGNKTYTYSRLRLAEYMAGGEIKTA